MFVLNDEGPNDFSIVVSRSAASATETLEEHVQRLKQELTTTLPKCELMDVSDRQYDGYPAAELRYRWSNNGVILYQRQAVALIKSSNTDHHAALMITATCPQPFSEQWDKAFADLLDSVRIRDAHRISTFDTGNETSAELNEDEVPEESHAASELQHIFALSIRDRVLHVFDDEEQACRRVNALEVEDGMWAFFNTEGKPLQAEFTTPNTGKIWRSEGKYHLRRPTLPTMLSLESHVDRIVRVVGASPLDSIAAIRLHLERQAGAMGAGVDARL